MILPKRPKKDKSPLMKRERGNCKICFTAIDPVDVSVSGVTADMAYNKDDEKCCGYVATGKAEEGFDCIIIPGLRKSAATSERLGDSACGHGAGLANMATGAAADSATVCSKRQPFNVRFRSDSYETLNELGIAGFRLLYTQNSNGC